MGNNYVVWIFRVSLSRRIILSNGNSHQNALTCKDFHNQMDKLVCSEILSHSSKCFSKWLYKQRKHWDHKGHMQGLLAWLTCFPPLLKTALAMSVTNLSPDLLLYSRYPTSQVVIGGPLALCSLSTLKMTYSRFGFSFPCHHHSQPHHP